jgi:hypothetical protein
MMRVDLLPGRSVRPATLAHQTVNALSVISPQPFAQRWSRNATAATDETRVVRLLVQANPDKALPLTRCEDVV